MYRGWRFCTASSQAFGHRSEILGQHRKQGGRSQGAEGVGSLEVPDVNQKVLTGRLGRSWADTRLESTSFPLTRWETQEAGRHRTWWETQEAGRHRKWWETGSGERHRKRWETGSGERHRRLGDTGSGERHRKLEEIGVRDTGSWES